MPSSSSSKKEPENLKDTHAYDNVITGKLKLKGSKLRDISSSKKKKRSKQPKQQYSTTATTIQPMSSSTTGVPIEQEEEEDDYIQVVEKTDAEKRFDKVRQQRERIAVEKMADKSYRERIDEFNKKISSESEHHDIPKVGPG
jgi:protein FAM32A